MTASLKISIITPSYNHGRFLEQTILSVINQDYDNIEYIIIDGASTDNSVEIIRKYEKHLAYWVSEPDKDLRYALQKGFARASGDVVAWQNADDYYEPDVFGRVVGIFQASPEVDLVYGDVNIVDENSRQIERLYHIPIAFPLDLFGGMPIQNHAAFFRRSLWERAGGIAFHELNFDIDLVYRLVRSSRPHFLRQPLGNYRNHKGSLSFSGKANNLQKDFWVIRRRFLGKWSRLPIWCFTPVVILAKARRYACLALMGEWHYFKQQIKMMLIKFL